MNALFIREFCCTLKVEASLTGGSAIRKAVLQMPRGVGFLQHQDMLDANPRLSRNRQRAEALVQRRGGSEGEQEGQSAPQKGRLRRGADHKSRLSRIVPGLLRAKQANRSAGNVGARVSERS